MRWLKLTIAYDGGGYAGWQFQPDRPTIQGALEQAWHDITGESAQIAGSGRTDAGVHALGQVASLSTASTLGCDVLLRALNAKLPRDIVVSQVEEVLDGFHASRDAISKCYRYQIHSGPLRSVIDRHVSWHVSQPLDTAGMDRAGQRLVGRHDFVSFQSAGSPRESTVRTILSLRVEQGVGDLRERVTIEVQGDGFLYNMVRTIVGTLVEIGRGREEESWVSEVLQARDRRRAGRTAPARGLFLVRVDYP